MKHLSGSWLGEKVSTPGENIPFSVVCQHIINQAISLVSMLMEVARFKMVAYMTFFHSTSYARLQKHGSSAKTDKQTSHIISASINIVHKC